jgi:hypothetical protein
MDDILKTELTIILSNVFSIIVGVIIAFSILPSLTSYFDFEAHGVSFNIFVITYLIMFIMIVTNIIVAFFYVKQFSFVLSILINLLSAILSILLTCIISWFALIIYYPEALIGMSYITRLIRILTMPILLILYSTNIQYVWFLFLIIYVLTYNIIIMIMFYYYRKSISKIVYKTGTSD